MIIPKAAFMPCQKFYAGIDILLRAFSVPVPRAFIRAVLHVEGRHAQFGYAAEIARLRALYTLRDNPHPARQYPRPACVMARAARFKKGFCSYLNQPRAVQKRARQGSQAFGSRSLVKPK